MFISLLHPMRYMGRGQIYLLRNAPTVQICRENSCVPTVVT